MASLLPYILTVTCPFVNAVELWERLTWRPGLTLRMRQPLHEKRNRTKEGRGARCVYFTVRITILVWISMNDLHYLRTLELMDISYLHDVGVTIWWRRRRLIVMSPIPRQDGVVVTTLNERQTSQYHQCSRLLHKTHLNPSVRHCRSSSDTPVIS